jgi:hypothetical protein
MTRSLLRRRLRSDSIRTRCDSGCGRKSPRCFSSSPPRSTTRIRCRVTVSIHAARWSFRHDSARTWADRCPRPCASSIPASPRWSRTWTQTRPPGRNQRRSNPLAPLRPALPARTRSPSSACPVAFRRQKIATRSGAYSNKASMRRPRFPPIAGPSMPITAAIPPRRARRCRDARPFCPMCAASIPCTSASRRARPSSWIRTSACSSSWPSKRWRTRVCRRRLLRPAPPRSSSARCGTTGRILRTTICAAWARIARRDRPSTCWPIACPTRWGFRDPAWSSTPPARRRW